MPVAGWKPAAAETAQVRSFFGLDEYVDHVRRSGVYSESRTYTATLEYTEAGAADAMVDGVEISVVG